MSFDFNALSQKLKDLLINTKEEQMWDNPFNGEERGHYVEFDSENCKPYTNEEAIQIQELCEQGVVVLHEDSDWAEEVDNSDNDDFLYGSPDEDEDEDEEEDFERSEGVMFVTIATEYLDVIPDA